MTLLTLMTAFDPTPLVVVALVVVTKMLDCLGDTRVSERPIGGQRLAYAHLRELLQHGDHQQHEKSREREGR